MFWNQQKVDECIWWYLPRISTCLKQNMPWNHRFIGGISWDFCPVCSSLPVDIQTSGFPAISTAGRDTVPLLMSSGFFWHRFLASQGGRHWIHLGIWYPNPNTHQIYPSSHKHGSVKIRSLQMHFRYFPNTGQFPLPSMIMGRKFGMDALRRLHPTRFFENHDGFNQPLGA